MSKANVAGGMALRILQGEKPQDIPRVKGVNTYMFDWRAVKRWGLKESEIPPGSIVLNRQPTVWEAYKDLHHWRHFSDLAGGVVDQHAAVAACETKEGGDRVGHDATTGFAWHWKSASR